MDLSKEGAASVAQVVAAPADALELRRRCSQYGRRQVDVEADGRCQFRALAVCLFGDAQRWQEVLQGIVDFLRQHPNAIPLGDGEVNLQEMDAATLSQLLQVPAQTFNGWVDSLAAGDQWGNNLTLSVAQVVFQRPIFVITPSPEQDRGVADWLVTFPTDCQGIPDNALFLVMTNQIPGTEHYAAAVTFQQAVLNAVPTSQFEDNLQSSIGLYNKWIQAQQLFEALDDGEITNRDIQEDVPELVRIALLGEAGVGKTTLLECLTGNNNLFPRDSGGSVTAVPIEVRRNMVDATVAVSVHYLPQKDCERIKDRARTIIDGYRELPEGDGDGEDQDDDVRVVATQPAIKAENASSLVGLSQKVLHQIAVLDERTGDYTFKPEVKRMIDKRSEDLSFSQLKAVLPKIAEAGALRQINPGDFEDDANDAMAVDLSEKPIYWPIVEKVAVSGPFLPSGVAIVDCPGVDGDEIRRLITNRTAESCPYRLIVVNATRPLKEVAQEYVRKSLGCEVGTVAIVVMEMSKMAGNNVNFFKRLTKMQMGEISPHDFGTYWDGLVKKARQDVEAQLSEILETHYEKEKKENDGVSEHNRFKVSGPDANLPVFYLESSYGPSYQPLFQWLEDKQRLYVQRWVAIQSIIESRIGLLRGKMQDSSTVGIEVLQTHQALVDDLPTCRRPLNESQQGALNRLKAITALLQDAGRLWFERWMPGGMVVHRNSWRSIATGEGEHEAQRGKQLQKIQLNVDIGSRIASRMLNTGMFENFFIHEKNIVWSAITSIGTKVLAMLPANKYRDLNQLIHKLCTAKKNRMRESIDQARQMMTADALGWVIEAMGPFYHAARDVTKKIGEKITKTTKNEIAAAFVDSEAGVFKTVGDRILNEMEGLHERCQNQIEEFLQGILHVLINAKEAKSVSAAKRILEHLEGDDGIEIEEGPPGDYSAHFESLREQHPLYFHRVGKLPKELARRGETWAPGKLHIIDKTPSNKAQQKSRRNAFEVRPYHHDTRSSADQTALKEFECKDAQLARSLLRFICAHSMHSEGQYDMPYEVLDKTSKDAGTDSTPSRPKRRRGDDDEEESPRKRAAKK
eukprot:TRINITY_DN2344_c0_g1_i2.p1 TRINITY_DN2344_c0_g1~~TRINITY_DN2344_c0_g1_i2.p1  ORF type:complete len:1081 (-),score=156.24 TRINITY_DN2344_c0_g1_i2:221-3463(-)